MDKDDIEATYNSRALQPNCIADNEKYEAEQALENLKLENPGTTKVSVHNSFIKALQLEEKESKHYQVQDLTVIDSSFVKEGMAVLTDDHNSIIKIIQF